MGLDMANKYYAVAKGKTPGIYFTWDDCKAQVEHFSGAVYKSFTSVAEAEAFVKLAEGSKSGSNVNDGQGKSDGQRCFSDMADREADAVTEEGTAVSTDTCLIAYVDGSYEHSRGQYAYGCVMVLPDQLVKLNGKDNDEEYVSMRNVAGEILGSEKAILWAVEHGYEEVVIYYDYEGIEKWANDIWKANKPGTIRYKQFVSEQRKKIKISFKKVAAHMGDTYNEMADELAKDALELRVRKADS